MRPAGRLYGQHAHLTCGPSGIGVAIKKLFQFLHQTTQALAEIPRSEAALRLFLQCAQAASECGLEPVTYEFMERAYEIFEESIPGTCYSPARVVRSRS